eukprot:TRINITY_DN14073_c0_g1_i2.p1 TRINITY_DN14073_c0_g1~~TRINITY_DN14073_c0_g1_i2.p1  ORF type:complete len:205 (+),score=54.06 TRINITY_DN14073_c0_g1_i2:64-678(+)
MCIRDSRHIVCSGFKLEQAELERLKTLGIRVVEDKKTEHFSILVMKEPRRTVNFLRAINMGAEIVSYEWLEKCVENIAPIEDYLMKAPELEEKYKFNLAESLQTVRDAEEGGFLAGWSFWVPKYIKPSLEEMKSLIESADGQVTKSKPKKEKKKDDEGVIILLNSKEDPDYEHFKGLGFTVHSPESVIVGCLRQEFDITQNVIE